MCCIVSLFINGLFRIKADTTHKQMGLNRPGFVQNVAHYHNFHWSERFDLAASADSSSEHIHNSEDTDCNIFIMQREDTLPYIKVAFRTFSTLYLRSRWTASSVRIAALQRQPAEAAVWYELCFCSSTCLLSICKYRHCLCLIKNIFHPKFPFMSVKLSWGCISAASHSRRHSWALLAASSYEVNGLKGVRGQSPSRQTS